eukprot:346327-Prorocentrum_lima.AAC.1
MPAHQRSLRQHLAGVFRCETALASTTMLALVSLLKELVSAVRAQDKRRPLLAYVPQLHPI